jgi:beta-xylosidase
MKALLLILSLTLVGCTPATDYSYPQVPPRTTPQIESDPEIVTQYLPLADPYILYHNGIYYAYGTSSDNGFEAYYTENDDLKYWKKHPGYILGKNDSYADRWFWAPEVYYNDTDKKFYLYYSADEHICVATGTSPLGPFTQTVQQPMRSEKSIDSSLFIDDDGTPYLYFVRFTTGNVIWVAEIEKDLMTIKESTLKQCIAAELPWETVQAKVAEGPSVLKRGGVYYLLYSANHYQNQGYGVGYATASSPFGPWTKSTDNPIFRRPSPDLVGTGHGAPFVDANGKMRYVFHAHSSTTAVQPRKLYITDMAITANGVTVDANTVIRPVHIK